MKKKKRHEILWAVWIGIMMLAGCKSYQKEQDERTDTYYRGTIHVSADESFKPVIDEQVRIYESRFPDAHILVDYKPEAECLKDMLNDSVRMVIATRLPSEKEANAVVDSLKTGLESVVLAQDAIAVIVNPQSPDSFFTMNEVRDVLKGNFNKNLIPVFDGIKATSTIRFVIDSVLKGQNITITARAATNSEDVLNYIARTPGAVGFVGVSWIGNREDTTQTKFLEKVKIAYLESTQMPGKYLLPYQLNIADKNYPMVRDLVYILKERHKGLGHAFGSFMSGEIGQLIFKRAYLSPARKSFILRKVELREDSPSELK